MNLLAGYGSGTSSDEEEEPVMQRHSPVRSNYTSAPSGREAYESSQSHHAQTARPDPQPAPPTEDPSRSLPAALWKALPPPSAASAKRAVRAQLPSHAALLAAASSLRQSAHADDDGPASKRAKGDGVNRSKLMDFLPAPKHAMHDFGGAPSGLGSGTGGGGSRRLLGADSLDPESSSAGARSAGSNQGGGSSRGAAAAPLPAGFFDPAALTGNNEMYRAVDAAEPDLDAQAGMNAPPGGSGMHDDPDIHRTYHADDGGGRSQHSPELDGTSQQGLHGDLGGGSSGRHSSAMYAAAGATQGASGGHHAGSEYHARSQPAHGSLGGGSQQHQQGRQQQQRQQYHSSGGGGSGADAGSGGKGGAAEEMSADAMFEEAVRLEREKALKRGHGKSIVPDIKFIEIKQQQLTHMDPSARSAAEGLRNAMGPEYAAKQRAAAKQFEGDKLAKRKHQIGTLFYNAKMAELDNMEKKGQGSKTKGETQAKYGW